MFLRHRLNITWLLLLTLAVPLAAQQAERRWIVDNSVAESGDGSPTSPFLTLAEAVRSAGEGDTIVLSAGEKAYAGGIALRTGQTLLGVGGTPVIEAPKGSVLAIFEANAPVTVANVAVRATGSASGIAIRDTRALVTLRDVTISTSGGAALMASRAAKLVIGGSSSIAAVDGPAVRIENAELDVVLRSLSAKGADLENGIVLQKTTGRFVVEGGTIEGASARGVSAIDASNVTLRKLSLARSALKNGVASSRCGGDLAAGSSEECSAAVYLQDVKRATLERVTVDGSAQAGIVAYRVNGLTITDSTVRGAGDELFEHGLILEELTGECRIAGTKIERSASRQLMLHNSGGRLALTIEKSVFAESGSPHGQQGVLVSGAGDAVLDVRVRDALFSRTFSHALDVTGADGAAITLRVTGSTFERNASAISLSITNAATIDYVIADNPSITGSENSAINVFVGAPSSGSISGTIARNTIGRSGVARSGAACASCSGITLTASGRGSLVSLVSGNVIQEVGGNGISATASQGSARLDLTVTSNLLRKGGGSAPAIRVQSGALPGDTTHVCASLGGRGAEANKIEGTWEPNGAIHLVHRFGGPVFRLVGLAAGNGAAAAAAAVGARNGEVKVRAVLRPESAKKGFEPADRCTMPALQP